MEEAKFTPGPWTISRWRRGMSILADGNSIARVYAINEANAPLIASAPDLLDALIDLVAAHPVPSSICAERPAYEKALAAIERATK